MASVAVAELPLLRTGMRLTLSSADVPMTTFFANVRRNTETTCVLTYPVSHGERPDRACRAQPRRGVLIRKCVAKIYGPLVTGQMWQTLDVAIESGAAKKSSKAA
jgi:hypothetical protein